MTHTVHITAEELHSVLAAAFMRSGLSPEAARDTADSLAEAECSGKRSHGLLRVEYVVRETMKRKPGPVEIERRGESFLGLNGNRHMGYHPGVIGIGKGTEIAARSGLCFVGIRNCIHSGMLGFFARRIAAEGYWGVVMAHCTALMAPHGGGRSVLGTNPLALGVPRKKNPPLIIDFSPAAYTYGQVQLDREGGRPLAPGIGLDKDGRPTTDPAEVMDGGTLLPASGPKGSALALLVQLICGPLIGAAPLPERGGDYGLSFLVIRPDLFHDASVTEAGVEAIAAAVESCPPASGPDRGRGGPETAVRLPGTASAGALEEAKKNGLSVDKKLWDKVRTM